MESHASGDGFPLAGEHGGKFYLRDANDNYRLYPGLFLQADTRAYFGRGLDDLHGTQGSTTRDKMYLRRARFDLGGEVLKSWSFYLTGDFAGATAQNPNGAPHLEHALIDVELHRLAHVTVGQQQVPFTMENRTNPAMYQWMERPLAVRFAQPSDKDIGIMAWGETRQHFFAYEAGVFSGDGPNRPNVDNRVDLAGRVHFRPLAGTQTIARNIQIGFSGTWGVRQHQDVLYDMPTLATDGGFVFFNANHTDPATGKTLHVLPSGTQSGFAGEVRVPVSRLDLRFEFVSVRRNTREALEGYVATNTERYGHLSGTAFYAQLGVWVLGKPSMRQDPGEFKTPHIRFPRGEPNRPARGLEVVARAESLRATYYAGDRANADVQPAADRNISVDVVGAGVNYYATTHAMVAINYNYNIFPSSWSTDNAALAPGNVPCGKVGGTPTDQACHTGAHSLHELAARVQIYF
jgi:phosphate-selective porin